MNLLRDIAAHPFCFVAGMALAGCVYLLAEGLAKMGVGQ